MVHFGENIQLKSMLNVHEAHEMAEVKTFCFPCGCDVFSNILIDKVVCIYLDYAAFKLFFLDLRFLNFIG